MAEELITDIVNRLKQVDGVVAIVLGGSRARNTHNPSSDIDIGIYYENKSGIDIEALQSIATEIDDAHRTGIVTSIGEWGKWLNGGGWLTVDHMPVDFLYRDLDQVASVIDDCLSGVITIDYYPGHPHGFVNSIYMAEIALCQILWDPSGHIDRMKDKTKPFNGVFKKAIIDKFLWEASFFTEIGKKSNSRKDIYYAIGCCFRVVSCLNQVLFAINEIYMMNEKGALDIIESFSYTPKNYRERIEEIFSLLTSESCEMVAAFALLHSITQETSDLIK